MSRQVASLLVFMACVLAAAVLLAWATTARAADPECVNPPAVNYWPCYDGVCSFCTPPTLSSTPLEIAMSVSCFTLFGGTQVHSALLQPAGTKIVIPHALDGDLPIEIQCEDDIGGTSGLAGLGRFSAGSVPADTQLAPPVRLPN